MQASMEVLAVLEQSSDLLYPLDNRQRSSQPTGRLQPIGVPDLPASVW